MELKDVVMKLIGPVDPVGSSHVDEVRLKNLSDLIDLTDTLIGIIDNVAYTYKDRVEYSVKQAADLAMDALNRRFGIKE